MLLLMDGGERPNLAARWNVVWALPMHLSNAIANDEEANHQSRADGFQMLDDAAACEDYVWP